MASHFGSVLQRGDRWRGRYQVSGKRYYTPTRKTKAAVRRDLVTVEASIIKGEWVPPAPCRRKTKDGRLHWAWKVGVCYELRDGGVQCACERGKFRKVEFRDSVEFPAKCRVGYSRLFGGVFHAVSFAL